MPFFSGRKREPSPPPREPTPPPVEEPRRRGLFSSRRERSPDYMHQQDQQYYPQQQQPVDPEPHGRRGHGLFGRRHRSPSPSASGGMAGGPRGRDSMTSHSSMSSGGYHDGPDTHRSGGMKRGFLSKRGRGRDGADDDDLDPSIIHARDRLMGAEAAEEDARRALAAAKESAASARDDIHRLEAEAREDARRAKIKESQARDFSKRGKALGRFG